MPPLLPILTLALGGAAGTLARVGLVAAVQRLHGSPWPLGTLTVNVLGCLAFGLLYAWLAARPTPSPLLTLLLLGGFCGAFTTFSTFAFDTHRLARDGGLLQPLAYVLATNALGLAAFFLAAWLGSRWFSAG